MKPYYQESGITIYHADCREVLHTLEPVDLVLADGPYGMDWNTDHTRFSVGPNGHGGATSQHMPPVHGDSEPFDPAPWLKFPHVILWGFHHFAARLPVGSVLVWIKRHDGGFGSFLSDADLAWMKGGHGVYCHRDTSMLGETRHRVHPTQKPVQLMKWCIEKSKATGTILDPFMGSGTTLRAAKDLGRQAIGIEIEERYCEVAANRLRQEVLSL